MIEPDIKVTVTKRMTVKLEEDHAAALLRNAVGAPKNAQVEFECGYDFLREITITWTEES